LLLQGETKVKRRDYRAYVLHRNQTVDQFLKQSISTILVLVFCDFTPLLYTLAVLAIDVKKSFRKKI